MNVKKITAGRPSQKSSKNIISLNDFNKKKELARANFLLPKSDYKKLKQYAIENETSITDILNKYIKTII